MTIIATLNWMDYLTRGNQYANALCNGVMRNTEQKVLGTLVTGLDSDNRMFHQFCMITEEHTPEGVIGWWNKLALFKPGLFPKGERVLYLDLDTIIVGDLTDLLAYDGPFAMLSDFYHSEALASGIMAWEAGDPATEAIWTRWDHAGRPQFDRRGDQAWIGQMMPDAARLQEVFPGQIVSFKTDCVDGVPEGARVVAFHGLPRPHTLHDLMQHW